MIDDSHPHDDETHLHHDGDSPTIASGSGGPARREATPLPDSIAGYSIVGKLGEGGMGVVYEAEQSQPRRRVALKVVRGGHFVDEEQVRMFQREADALARLKHPNIGGIYESGCTDDGQHYFAMELVRGRTLDEWLRGQPRDTSSAASRTRLRLLATIAEAVHYAHQRGVIHRDLKPSNIVVTDEDVDDASRASAARGPSVKILDFGLARITDTDVVATQVTEVGMIKGTLAYMSPEQARGDADAIDLRSDVYALGVMLYEMLVGTRPYEMSGSLMEAVKIICERPPTPLRESWRGPHKLDPDLETIVGKALAKDPAMRYPSAAALSEDIDRFLTSQPILARPPSTIYQLRKAVARNKLAAALAASMLVLLVGFGVAVSVLFARSLAAEARATRQAETAERALGFMTEMFEVSDPSQARGETVTAREILDRGALRIERELGDQPAVRSALMETMGQVYGGLGLYDRAERLLSSAADERASFLGEEHPDSLDTATELATVVKSLSRYEEAESLLRTTIERQERVLGPEHADTLESKIVLADVLRLQSRFEEARLVSESNADAARRVLGETHEITLEATNQLGLVHAEEARYDEAERSYLTVLDTRRRLLGEDHPDTLSALNNVAELYMTMGRYDEAEALFRRGLDEMRRVQGTEHRDTLLHEANLGRLYGEQYRWEDAEAVYRRILEIQRRTLGNEHLDTLMSLNTMGVFLANQGRSDEAEPYYDEALAGLRRVFGDDHKETLTAQGNLAMLYLFTDRAEGAEELGRKTYEGAKALYGADHPTTLLYLENVGNMLYTQDDLSGAAEILDRVLEGRRRGLGDEHPAVNRTLVNLSVVRGNAGDEAGAASVREELLERARAGISPDHPNVANEIEKLAASQMKAGDVERSFETYEEVVRIRRSALGDEDPATLNSLRIVVKLAARAERLEEAETHARACQDAHAAAPDTSADDVRACVEPLVEGYEKLGDAERAAAWRAQLS